MKYETASDFKKKSDWNGTKYLLTPMENIVQFLRNIGNSVLNLFVNFCLNDNLLEFWMVNNFEILNMYLRSIK